MKKDELKQHQENVKRGYEKDFTIKEYFERNMHRECDDNVNQTHFRQMPLSVNEFAKRHSDYLEQKRIDEAMEYNGNIHYGDMYRIIWESYVEYYEAFKYNAKGFVKWTHRVNEDLLRMPYPIQKNMVRYIKEREMFDDIKVQLVTPMIKEGK
jgi:hypothetical protein